MSRASVELNVPAGEVGLPIIWRLGELFKVSTNIRKARVSSQSALVSLDIDGSAQEIEQAQVYLRSLGVIDGTTASPPTERPEDAIEQRNTIVVRLTTVTSDQAAAPILARVSRDFRVVINIVFSSLDEQGGTIEIAISGALLEVQRAISFLHTTGLRVFPHERSVSDLGNL